MQRLLQNVKKFFTLLRRHRQHKGYDNDCNIQADELYHCNSSHNSCMAWVKGKLFISLCHNISITAGLLHSLPDAKILDLFKLKQIADDILKCI